VGAADVVDFALFNVGANTFVDKEFNFINGVKFFFFF
jgi:hypothetical protein